MPGIFTDVILQKLDWPFLVEKLAEKAQAQETTENLKSLTPLYTQADRLLIEKQWEDISSLKEILRLGFRPPVGSLPIMGKIFASSEKGQILESTDLRSVLEVLLSTKRVLGFAADFSQKSRVLHHYKTNLSPLPKVVQIIEKSIGSTGEILDDATPELRDIRKQRIQLRKKMEEVLTNLMRQSPFEEYLQDQFFTMRNDRYVLPIRLDGRGRVKGSIVSISESGQTLFVEPQQVTLMNEQLQEVDVAERLEILTILRTISAMIATSLDVLRLNYEELLILDSISAKAAFALETNSGTAQISDEPILELLIATHPLLDLSANKLSTVIANNIILKRENRSLVISGPNAGGKTVVLKTVGLVHAMAHAGLLIPVDEKSKIYFFEHYFLELGDAQSLGNNLSTFSGHLLGILPAVQKAGPNDLVLLDELATGTDPETGSAIAQAVLEHLVQKNALTILTTHYDRLKTLGFENHQFRNASMEYTIESMKPTYRLILDVPGQSYGLELASQIGIPQTIIARARDLKGTTESNLDYALSELALQREKSQALAADLEQKVLAAEEEKFRWQQECKLLEESRKKATQNVTAFYEDQIEALRKDLEDTTGELKKSLKNVVDDDLRADVLNKRHQAQESLKNVSATLKQLSRDDAPVTVSEPSLQFQDLVVGKSVFIRPIGKTGKITKIPESKSAAIEVEVGIMKMRVPLKDLGLSKTSENEPNIKITTPKPIARRPIKMPELVLRTPTNALDLRGMEADQATKASLDFIDKAMLRGEPAILLIHGHGSDRLKTEVRALLAGEIPYEVAFRPGIMQEGGDGVTIVSLE